MRRLYCATCSLISTVSHDYLTFRGLFACACSATFGAKQIDYLVNNAGHGGTAPLTESTEEAFDRLNDVHFKGVLFFTLAMLPLIRDGGRIVNVSSGLTRFTVPGYSMYAAMKSATEALTRYMAKEFGARGITVNVVAPGPAETDFNAGAVRENDALKKHLSAASPLGRVAGPSGDIGTFNDAVCEKRRGLVAQERGGNGFAECLCVGV